MKPTEAVFDCLAFSNYNRCDYKYCEVFMGFCGNQGQVTNAKKAATYIFTHGSEVKLSASSLREPHFNPNVIFVSAGNYVYFARRVDRDKLFYGDGCIYRAEISQCDINTDTFEMEVVSR